MGLGTATQLSPSRWYFHYRYLTLSTALIQPPVYCDDTARVWLCLGLCFCFLFFFDTISIFLEYAVGFSLLIGVNTFMTF